MNLSPNLKTLNLYLKLNNKRPLPRAFEINNYEKIQKLISKQNFNKLKILITGIGRASKGAIEFLKHAKFEIKVLPQGTVKVELLYIPEMDLPEWHYEKVNKQRNHIQFQKFLQRIQNLLIFYTQIKYYLEA